VRHGFAYSAEFQNDVGQLCVTTSSASASLKYVLSDLQGTTRSVMNNNGSSSAVIARHDYLPFGEEIWSGTGTRTSSQGYGGTDAIRQKYGLTERDDATGLDHTPWRKLESFSGRWTSPDPYNGSMTIVDPQSFNRYAHVQNDPVNFVDPSGLQDPPGGWPTDPSAYGYAYTQTWAPYYPGGSPGQGRHGMLLDTDDGQPFGGNPFIHIPGVHRMAPKSCKAQLSPTPTPQNLSYDRTTITGGPFSGGMIVDSNSQVFFTFGVGPSKIPASVVQTQGSGPVNQGVYLSVTGSNVLAASQSVNLTTGAVSSEVGRGTPQGSASIEVVVGPLQGTTPYDWDHYPDNPNRKGLAWRPVGRCPY